MYSQNEVAGDKMFFRKATLLTGSIASINSGLGNAPYLVFKTKSFAGAQAHMAKDLVDRVATLKKGQKISVYCEGAGSVAGVPIFKNCKFSDDIAQTEWARFEQDIVNHYNGVPNPPLPVGPVAVMLAAHTPALPPKACSKPDDRCWEAFTAAATSKEGEVREDAIREKFRALGMVVTKP